MSESVCGAYLLRCKSTEMEQDGAGESIKSSHLDMQCAYVIQEKILNRNRTCEFIAEVRVLVWR